MGAAGVAHATPADDARADVVGVTVRGKPGAYVFEVTLRSPDRGCDRYADWWELVRADGSLVYRRVLLHSHVDEQPFTRSGGPIDVGPDEILVVRGHLHPDGYGGAALRGSVAGGFSPWDAAPARFAADLARSPPRPGGCLR